MKATTEGVVRLPSLLGITTGSLPSLTETRELVVPKSIPIIFAIVFELLFVLFFFFQFLFLSSFFYFHIFVFNSYANYCALKLVLPICRFICCLSISDFILVCLIS